MRAGLKDRVIGSGKASTVVSFLVSTALAGAAQYYQQSGGNVGSWQPYAVAGGLAIAGALFKPKQR